MADTSEQRIERLQQRLRESRVEVFALAQAIKGHEPAPGASDSSQDGGFPHSRLMRALLGKPGGIALGTVAVAATVMRPTLLLRALKLTPMLRPVLMRWVLPRLLGQR